MHINIPKNLLHSLALRLVVVFISFTEILNKIQLSEVKQYENFHDYKD